MRKLVETNILVLGVEGLEVCSGTVESGIEIQPPY
jgi:hypothetical protein